MWAYGEGQECSW